MTNQPAVPAPGKYRPGRFTAADAAALVGKTADITECGR